MKNNKELIVFDLDGTLIDTLKDLNNAVNYALGKNGYQLRDIEHTRKSIGDGVAMLMRRSLPQSVDENTYQKALKDFEDYYHEHAYDFTTPYEGMNETLVELKKRGYKLAVSTNKIEDVAQKLIDKFYPGLFDTVCGDNKVRARKPAPDSINEIMRRLNIFDKSKIVYIGDTEVDYQTAKNSEVDCLIVSYGYRKKDELKSHKLDTESVNCLQNIPNYFN